MSLKITQDWTVEKEASGGDEDMLRFLQVESLESLKFKWFPRCEAFALTHLDPFDPCTTKVLRVNGIEVPSGFTGLYAIACRANHSCAYTTQRCNFFSCVCSHLI